MAGIENRQEGLDQMIAAGREAALNGEAVRLLRAADESAGRGYGGTKQVAVDTFDRGDYEAAADLFRQMLDEPNVPGWTNAEVHYNLAQCLLQRQDYDGARYHLEQANGQSAPAINQHITDLLQRLDRLDATLAIVQPQLAL